MPSEKNQTVYQTDVDKNFAELKAQLIADDIAPDSAVGKTLRRLSKALKKDGFTLQAEHAEHEEVEEVEVSTTTATTVAKPATDYTVKAFRVATEGDAEAVTAVFGEIDGWKTRTVDIKGRTYVVVTNAPRWSKKRIRSAISTAIQGPSVSQEA